MPGDGAVDRVRRSSCSAVFSARSTLQPEHVRRCDGGEEVLDGVDPRGRGCQPLANRREAVFLLEAANRAGRDPHQEVESGRPRRKNALMV